MTLWPDSVELGGTSIPLAGVLADVVIHHGRTELTDEPTATTCQLTLHEVTSAFVQEFDIGQSLVLTVDELEAPGTPTPRFTGNVTDAHLEGSELTVIAVGKVATFRNYPIGAVNWPEETWSARVTRAFTEAGLASELELHPDPNFNPVLAARDAATAGETTLADYLAFLAPMVGALIADRLSGGVLVQAIGSRRLEDATELEPADVLYSPAWSEELPGANIVTVRYQADQGASVEAQDASSIARYGERTTTIDTSFKLAADASYRASQYLSRNAFSHWEMRSAPILRGLELALGAPVIISGLPASAPYDPWTPIVEGWTDTISAGDPDRPSTWLMELALTDPLLSGVALPWQAVPLTPVYHWNTVDPATDWTEALTLESLEL